MIKRNYRRLSILLAFISSAVLGASLYLQYISGYEPCPLCLMQRVAVLGLLMLCLMGTMLNTLKRAKTISFFQMFFSLAGLFFVGRQLWLQSFPAGTAPACMPELDILLHYFPWQDVVKTLLWGSASCGEVVWSWLGLSMPAWACLYFLFMFFSAIGLFIGLDKKETDIN